MSFTQEKQANICVCDGCDTHCKLGISIETKQEAKEATRSASGLVSEKGLPYMRFAYPEIGGKRITDYYDQNGNYEIVSFDAKWLNQDNVLARTEYRNRILDTARKIAKLCDRYKQDTPQTKPQTNDDMIQVRLYDSLDKCYYNLGTPVPMGCALSLLKRFHDTPRPEEICLDDDIKRFRGLHAELTTYYPGRYSDYANGVLSLIAPYRYTCKKCEMAPYNSNNMQNCAKNIMSGKCRDEFVRQTVGITLFPEHYAKDKQR